LRKHKGGVATTFLLKEVTHKGEKCTPFIDSWDVELGSTSCDDIST
jgi:hypothetical protein